ncbi:lipase [Thalassotalea profundi]|uniref:Lipase n=2 Tax=Thalassotalea profundi TaxID=2036687 RepID=A0ABQ3IHS4_9GAMM|nr:lipase [Thalassotalea profundi]
MKKLMLGLVIASSLGLTACENETVKDVQENVATEEPVFTAFSRVVFDPTAGDVSVPNDLLFQGSTDGTLNLPVTDPTDESDPYVALSALDGWSTVNPFVLDIDFPQGRSLDGNSVFSPSSVRIFEAIMGGDTSDADCASIESGLACKIVGELTYTEDFITQKSGNSIAVVPLKPLKGKTTYLVALTDNLLDSTGKAIAGSSTYELVSQDINTQPLATESQLGLQAIINSFETAVSSAGVEKESIIYSFALTTQSTTDVLFTNKALMAANVQQGVYPSISVSDTGASVADILAGQIPNELVPLYSAANFMQGSITLPYYLGVPSASNPTAPVNQWWTSLCDSAAMLAGLAAQNPAAIPADAISETDAQCMAISQANGLPAPGLRDLGIDKERNLTKYSPVAKPTAMMPLAVQVTTPDLAVVNAIRAQMSVDPEVDLPPISEPADGWPVVILQHGITSKKEDMLPMTGILSVYGFATVAINHPLHGDPSLGGRGWDLNEDGIDEINASTVSATHYMNLASLLTTRDNLRQSVSDMVGLRFGLNFLSGSDVFGAPINVDSTNVHFLGHSLGAITGINFMAIANTPLNPAIDPMFKVTTNSLAMPGVMVANFLMESGAFGDVIKANLTYAQSADFKAYVDTLYPSGASETELVTTYQGFYASLTPSQQGTLDGTFQQFAFAAQTVTDSGDPINYATTLAATQTPTHVIEVVGNGADNLSDQVIPNTVSSAPLGGTEGAIALLGLPPVGMTTQNTDGVSGAVRFTAGHHGSILTPGVRAEAPDAAMNAKATQEMQSQVANFFGSNGTAIVVSDTDVVMQ